MLYDQKRCYRCYEKHFLGPHHPACEKPVMKTEALRGEGFGDRSGFVNQQLGFDAVNARRLLQGFDYVAEQLPFDIVGIMLLAVADVEIADHAFAAFIDEERIAEDAAAIDGGIARKYFGVDITQNHVGGAVIIPAQQLRPGAGFVVQ